MNPWNEAEASDESLERELFARRARALDAPDVPSLSAVMRAAEARRLEVAPVKGNRGHAPVLALALAAACAMAAITRLPRGETPPGDTIRAEIDAGPAATFMTAAASNEVATPGSTCSLDDERLARGEAEERECVAPAAQYTPVPDTCAASHAAAVAPCDPNESCALGAQ